jgi:hypothetical protein
MDHASHNAALTMTGLTSGGRSVRRFNEEVNGMAKGLVLFLALGIVAVAFGQTSADLSAKYQQITAYELRPDVVMTPKYATDGQVCEIAIERRQKTETGIVFAAPFSEDEVRHFIDELAPEGERGRNLTKTLNERVDGGFITTEYTYENVLVRVYGTTRPAPAGDRVITITWPKRTCSGAAANKSGR